MTLCAFNPPIMGIAEWDVNLTTPLGQGAAATVYKESINGEDFALKIYNDASKIELQKLKSMVSSPPNMFRNVNGKTYPIFGWVLSLVFEKSSGKPIGFVMPLVDDHFSKTLDFYYDFILTQKLTSPISKALSFKVEILANLCEAIADLHDRGHQFVDLKPQNLRVFEGTNVVSLIDCDGFTITDSDSGNVYRAKMVSPDYIAPEIASIDLKYEAIPKSQDEYALAVIIFQMLNRGIHPFQGILINPDISADTNDRKAEMGLYAYGVVPSKDISPLPSSIHDFFLPETRELFDSSFTSNIRPSASVWAEHFRSILRDKNIIRCDDHPNDIEHMRFRGNECPVCAKPLGKPKLERRKEPEAAADAQVEAPLTGKGSPLKMILFISMIGASIAAFGFSSSRQNPATVWLEFCNQTSKSVSVAVSHKVRAVQHVEAWFNINPSQCTFVGNFERSNLNWYATSAGREWQANAGSLGVCLNLKSSVKNVASTSCAKGEVLKRFHKFVTDQDRATMTLKNQN